MNFHPKSYAICFYFILYFHVWIRIRIGNTDPQKLKNTDPQHCFYRYGIYQISSSGGSAFFDKLRLHLCNLFGAGYISSFRCILPLKTVNRSTIRNMRPMEFCLHPSILQTNRSKYLLNCSYRLHQLCNTVRKNPNLSWKNLGPVPILFISNPQYVVQWEVSQDFFPETTFKSLIIRENYYRISFSR